jgi:hypothetical protein
VHLAIDVVGQRGTHQSGDLATRSVEHCEAEWLVPAQLNRSSPHRFIREDYAVIEEAAYRSEYLIGPHILVVGLARK